MFATAFTLTYLSGVIGNADRGQHGCWVTHFEANGSDVRVRHLVILVVSVTVGGLVWWVLTELAAGNL